MKNNQKKRDLIYHNYKHDLNGNLPALLKIF